MEEEHAKPSKETKDTGFQPLASSTFFPLTNGYLFFIPNTTPISCAFGDNTYPSVWVTWWVFSVCPHSPLTVRLLPLTIQDGGRVAVAKSPFGTRFSPTICTVLHSGWFGDASWSCGAYTMYQQRGQNSE